MRRMAIMLLMATAAVPALAGPSSRAGTASAVYLRLARPAGTAGMGDVVTAVDRGVWSTWGNPAGVIRTSRREIGVTRIQSFADISINMLGYAQPITDRDVVALSYTGVDYGKIEGRDVTGRATGDVRAGDDAGGLTWGHRWGEKTATGVTLRYLSSRLGTRSAEAFTFDVGATWQTPVDGLTLGAAGQNLVGELKFVREGYTLPRTVRVGFAQRLMNERLLVAVDVVKGIDTDWEVAGGAELSVMRNLILRAGYSPRDEGTPVTFGLGLDFRRFDVDYAYLPFGDLGDQHRVSLMAEF